MLKAWSCHSSILSSVVKTCIYVRISYAETCMFQSVHFPGKDCYQLITIQRLQTLPHPGHAAPGHSAPGRDKGELSGPPEHTTGGWSLLPSAAPAAAPAAEQQDRLMLLVMRKMHGMKCER